MKKTELLKMALHPKNWKTLYKEHKEIVNYVIFGVGTTIVSFGAYYIFRFIFPNEQSVPEAFRWIFNITSYFNVESNTVLPNLLSWICAVTFAYITNRLWVFESRAKGFGRIVLECLSFFASRLLTLFVDILIMFLLVDLTGIVNPIYEFFAKCVSSVFVLVLNYVFSKLFVFRKKKDTNVKNDEEKDSEANS